MVIVLIVAVLVASAYYLYKINTPPLISNAVASQEVTVNASNFSFSPSEIKVKQGQPVKIIFNNKDGFHDLVIDEFNVNTGRINGGQSKTIEFTPTKTGNFFYYCSVGDHRAQGMQGTIIVE